MSRTFRSPLLLLLALLLVVRAWAGDAMAVGMVHAAAPSAFPAAAHANMALPPCHEAPADAAHATNGPGSAAHGEDATPDATGAVCSACQICHSLALSAAATLALPCGSPRAAPLGAPVRFASAEPRRQHKPPIS